MNECQFCNELKPTVNGFCKSCEEQYTRVRQYIDMHNSPNLLEICNATKTSPTKIRRFIEKGHFEQKKS
jgi:hypothetical protein